MTVLTPCHFRSAQFPPFSGSWPRRLELFSLTCSRRPMISLMPLKPTWCENCNEFALTQVGGHAMEEHSPPRKPREIQARVDVWKVLHNCR